MPVYQGVAHANKATIELYLWFKSFFEISSLTTSVYHFHYSYEQIKIKIPGNWQHIIYLVWSAVEHCLAQKSLAVIVLTLLCPGRGGIICTLSGLSNTSYCICTKCYVASRNPLVNHKNYLLIVFNRDLWESLLSLLPLLHAVTPNNLLWNTAPSRAEICFTTVWKQANGYLRQRDSKMVTGHSLLESVSTWNRLLSPDV